MTYTINMMLPCVQIFVVSFVLPLMAFGGVYKYYFMHENTLGSLGTEIKVWKTLFSVRKGRKIRSCVRYFPSVGTDI